MREKKIHVEDVLDIMKEPTYTKEQRAAALVEVTENMFYPYELPEKTLDLLSDNSISDMGEGIATYKCRYCVPDFDLFLRQGSRTLRLEPPSDIHEAINALQILYRHSPGLSQRNHYIGHLDRLLEPFIVDEEEARKAIRNFLIYIDRTAGDSFSHADLGPQETKAGRIILEETRALQNTIPSLSFIYDEEKTPDDFALLAFRTAMETAKPSFCNDRIYREELGDYAVASCYNTLPIGGCGMTLNRLMLHNLVKRAKDTEDFLSRVLPEAVHAVTDMIDRRIQFIVDECHFVENTFLYREGLLVDDDEHMVGMFGFVGLAEAVNYLRKPTTKDDRFGRNEEANALGVAIMDKIAEEVGKHHMKHGVLRIHAQVGNGNDTDGMTPGGRIPIGDEPDIPTHIRVFAEMHRHCSAGCGELFAFESTARNNPEFLLDILKGAFREDARYLSFYANDTDLVRVTGYLVKRSDMEALKKGEMVLNGSTLFGLGASENLRVLDRKERRL